MGKPSPLAVVLVLLPVTEPPVCVEASHQPGLVNTGRAFFGPLFLDSALFSTTKNAAR